MSDIKSEAERSRNMSHIRNKDTRPEVWFRKQLFSRGYRYRKNVSSLPGHPDLWLSKYNTAIFIHGCFWHRHANCRFAYVPKSNVEFWNTKFRKNMERDIYVLHQLELMKIRTVVIWECTIKNMIRDESIKNMVLAEVSDFLHSDKEKLELYSLQIPS